MNSTTLWHAGLALAVLAMMGLALSTLDSPTGFLVVGENASFGYFGPETIIFSSSLVMDIAEYVNQSGLTYIITESPGLEATLSGSVLIAGSPEAMGTYNLTVIASSGDAFLRIPLVVVKDTTQTPSSLIYPFAQTTFSGQDHYGLSIDSPIVDSASRTVTYHHSPVELSGVSSRVTLSNVTTYQGTLIAVLGPHSSSGLSTEVFAINTLNVSGAELSLARFGPVDTIFTCPQFDSTTSVCSGGWQPSSIPFLINDTHVTFSVDSFSAYGGGQSGVTYVFSCGALTSASTTYRLANDLFSASGCLSVQASDVTLDCAGHSINYSHNQQGAGISASGVSGLEIQNCRLQSTDSESPSVDLSGTSSSSVINSTITSSLGIKLSSAQGTRIENSQVLAVSQALTISGGSHTDVVTTNLSAAHTASLEATNSVTFDGVKFLNLSNPLTTSGSTSDIQLVNSSFVGRMTTLTFDGPITVPSATEITLANLRLEPNFVKVNSEAYPFLNTSATITVLGIEFIGATIGVSSTDDGTYQTCSAPDCTIISNDAIAKKLVFSVPHFTSYSASSSSVSFSSYVVVASAPIIPTALSCAATRITTMSLLSLFSGASAGLFVFVCPGGIIAFDSGGKLAFTGGNQNGAFTCLITGSDGSSTLTRSFPVSVSGCPDAGKGRATGGLNQAERQARQNERLGLTTTKVPCPPPPGDYGPTGGALASAVGEPGAAINSADEFHRQMDQGTEVLRQAIAGSVPSMASECIGPVQSVPSFSWPVVTTVNTPVPFTLTPWYPHQIIITGTPHTPTFTPGTPFTPTFIPGTPFTPDTPFTPGTPSTPNPPNTPVYPPIYPGGPTYVPGYPSELLTRERPRPTSVPPLESRVRIPVGVPPVPDPKPLPICGNGKVEPGENCENDAQCAVGEKCGKPGTGKACQCYKPALPNCGNGILEAGEQCEGNAACVGLFGLGSTCDITCRCITSGYCGDGVWDPYSGEECESNGDCESNDDYGPGSKCSPIGSTKACKCYPPEQAALFSLELGQDTSKGITPAQIPPSSIIVSYTPAGPGVPAVPPQLPPSAPNQHIPSLNPPSGITYTSAPLPSEAGDIAQLPAPIPSFIVTTPVPEPGTEPTSMPSTEPSPVMLPPASVIAPFFASPEFKAPAVRASPDLGIACGYIGSRGNSQELSLSPAQGSLNLPSGYESASTPFSISCSGDSLSVSIAVDPTYTDLNAYRCSGGSCSPLPSRSTQDELFCGPTPFDTLLGQVISAPRSLSYQPGLIDLELTQVSNSSPRVDVSGWALTLSLSDERPVGVRAYNPVGIPTPSNAHMGLASVPITFEFENMDERFVPAAIQAVFQSTSRYEPGSYTLFIIDGDRFVPLDGFVSPSTRTILAPIKDLSQWVRNGRITFVVMATICDACENSLFEKVYDGDSDRALVLVHGFSSSSLTWTELVEDMRRSGRPEQVWVYSYPSTFSVREIAGQLINSLEANNAKWNTLTLLGHSLGGIVVQQALYDGNLQRRRFVAQTEKAIIAGSPNDGSPIAQMYQQLFAAIINSKTFARPLPGTPELLSSLIYGEDIPQVPSVRYEVVAGTEPYIFSSRYFDSANDGITSVPGAQHIGSSYVNKRCDNYFDLGLTHTSLIDQPVGLSVLQGRTSETQTGRQYVQVSIDSCRAGETFVVAGRKIDAAAAFDPLGCACGNGVCGLGEDTQTCPVDCAATPEGFGFGMTLMIMLIILVLLIIGVLVLSSRKRRGNGPALFTPKSPSSPFSPSESGNDIEKMPPRTIPAAVHNESPVELTRSAPIEPAPMPKPETRREESRQGPVRIDTDLMDRLFSPLSQRRSAPVPESLKRDVERSARRSVKKENERMIKRMRKRKA